MSTVAGSSDASRRQSGLDGEVRSARPSTVQSVSGWSGTPQKQTGRPAKTGRKRPIRRKRAQQPTKPPHGDEQPVEPTEPVTSFMALAMDFEAALDDLEQREGMENLHTEFLRVFRRLEETRCRESSLLERVEQLEQQKRQVELHLEQQLEQAEQREASLGHEEAREEAKQRAFQDEVAQLRARCDMAAEREQAAVEAMESMRKQLDAAERDVVVVDTPLGVEDEKKAVKLARERDLLEVKVAALKEKLQKAERLQDEVSGRADALELRVSELTQQVADEKERKQREVVARVELEAEYKALQSELEAKKHNLSSRELQSKMDSIKISRLETTVAELADANEALTKESGKLGQRVAELKSLMRKRDAELQKAVTNWQDVSASLHHLENSLNALELKVAASESLNKMLGADLDKARHRVSCVLAEAARYKLEARDLHRDLSDAKTQLAVRGRDVRSLDVSKGVLAKQVARLANELAEQEQTLAQRNTYIKELERRLEEALATHDRLAVQTEGLKRARDHAESRITSLTARLEAEREATREERHIAERYKRGLADNSRKLTIIRYRQEANDRQTVRLGRTTAAAVEREEDMRTQVKALTCLAEQMKEEVARRDEELSHEKYYLSLSEKVRNELSDQVNKLQAESVKRLDEMADLRRQLVQCDESVRALERERDQRDRDQLAAIKERDNLGDQLARRNDEVALLRAKVGVLERVLQGGERELACCQDATRLLRLEVRKLRWERQLLADNSAGMPRLEQELHHTIQDLSRTQHLARALEEELSTPVNFHRWRLLEGTDLPHLQLLQKVASLQKRLMSRSEQMVLQEAKLRRTEGLYLQLRQAFARQPADPTALLLTRAALQNKQRKLKGLMVEVSLSEAAHSQLDEANKEIARLKSAGPLGSRPHYLRLPRAASS